MLLIGRDIIKRKKNEKQVVYKELNVDLKPYIQIKISVYTSILDYNLY